MWLIVLERLSKLVYIPDYDISVEINGNIYKDGKKLKQYRDYKGYPCVIFKNGKAIKNMRVHKLVAQAYVPNPKGLPIVNHIDGDKENSSADNLEWCSIKDNTVHAYRVLGNKVPNGVKSSKKVLVRDKHGNEKIFDSIRSAAKFIGCCHQHLSSLLKKRTGTKLEFEFEYS